MSKDFDDELIAFANNISKRYKTYPDGYYNSQQGKYRIQLVEKLGGLHTPSRVSYNTCLIQLQRSKIDNVAFCFFLILWCVKMREEMEKPNPDPDKSHIYADKVCIEYFLANNKYVGTTIKSMLKMLSEVDNELNRKRAELLSIYL